MDMKRHGRRKMKNKAWLGRLTKAGTLRGKRYYGQGGAVVKEEKSKVEAAGLC